LADPESARPMLPGWNWVNILPDCAARAVRTIEDAAKTQPQKPFFLYSR